MRFFATLFIAHCKMDDVSFAYFWSRVHTTTRSRSPINEKAEIKSVKYCENFELELSIFLSLIYLTSHGMWYTWWFVRKKKAEETTFILQQAITIAIHPLDQINRDQFDEKFVNYSPIGLLRIQKLRISIKAFTFL